MCKGTKEGGGSGERNVTAVKCEGMSGETLKPESSELPYPTGRAPGVNDHILGGFKKTERCSPSSEARLLMGRCQQASRSKGSWGWGGRDTFLASSGFRWLSACDLWTCTVHLCLHPHPAFSSLRVSTFSLLLLRTKNT